MCVSPQTIAKGIHVPCAKCGECLQARRRDWAFRLAKELRASESAYFITLTYNEENVPRDVQGRMVLVKSDFQQFMARLRRECGNDRIRYYAVGEYGETYGRPHYHLLLFRMPSVHLDVIDKIWGHGNIFIGTVSDASIYYCAKFHVNPLPQDDGRPAPFALMSRRPGIGARYVETHGKWHLDARRNFVVHPGGMPGRLPRYYRDRIFSKGTLAFMASRGMQESDLRYGKELQRLSFLGYANPSLEYDARKIYHALNVNQKNPMVSRF